MKIFKFGGASVKNAGAVQNLLSLLVTRRNAKIVIVVSAMDKTTVALEKLADIYFNNKPDCSEQFNRIKRFHFDIAEELFPDTTHDVFSDLSLFFMKLERKLAVQPSLHYDYEYDQIVSYGELWSTIIVSAYLKQNNLINRWIDISYLLKTDNTYREAKVNWTLSEKLIKEALHFNNTNIYVTQGFIGGTLHNFYTTLGKEGSDFTATALAYILKTRDVTIWKDVDGVYNCDPKQFSDAIKLDIISYKEAIEMAYYGAKVIHPKTIKPLQNKNIPLHVKSFENPDIKGTIINDSKLPNSSAAYQYVIPVFILKENQILISIQPKDFSFIMEENLSRIFELFSKHRVKTNLIQNSAISFSVVVDNNRQRLPALIKVLQSEFNVLFNAHLQLLTIRHYTKEIIEQKIAGKHIYLEQKSRYTVRYLFK